MGCPHSAHTTAGPWQLSGDDGAIPGGTRAAFLPMAGDSYVWGQPRVGTLSASPCGQLTLGSLAGTYWSRCFLLLVSCEKLNYKEWPRTRGLGRGGGECEPQLTAPEPGPDFLTARSCSHRPVGFWQQADRRAGPVSGGLPGQVATNRAASNTEIYLEARSVGGRCLWLSAPQGLQVLPPLPAPGAASAPAPQSLPPGPPTSCLWVSALLPFVFLI